MKYLILTAIAASLAACAPATSKTPSAWDAQWEVIEKYRSGLPLTEADMTRFRDAGYGVGAM